jgi:hypothetical protein
MANTEIPAFSRSSGDADSVELRGLAPVALAQALDALAHADGMNRNAYVNSVLDAHVKLEAHKTMVRHRMLRGNPYLKDAEGGSAE